MSKVMVLQDSKSQKNLGSAIHSFESILEGVMV